MSGIEDVRIDEIECFASYLDKPFGETRAYINSVGESALWVIDSEGPVVAGSYVTTSTIPGYACAQVDDLHRSCTAAKLTMCCNFVTVFKPHLVPTGTMDNHGDAVWMQCGTEPNYMTRNVLEDGTIVNLQEATLARAADVRVFRATFLGCTYTCWRSQSFWYGIFLES